MKKLLSLLLCLTFLCSAFLFTSCTPNNNDENPPATDDGSTLNGKSAEELYDSAMEKLKNLTNFEMVTSQALTMSYQGESQTGTQTVITKMDGRNCYMKTESELSAEANMEVWYVSEWYYLIQGNNKIKANLTWEKMQEFMPQGSTGDSALMNLPKEWFKDIKFEKENDRYYIQFILSGEDYLNYIESALNTGVDMSMVEDISYKVYFDQEGNLGEIVTEFDITAEGLTMTCKAITSVINMGTVTIEAPEGNFTEIVIP